MKSILLFIFVALFLVGCGDSESDPKCEIGFYLVNGACSDINECELELDQCPNGFSCVNSDGSFSCEEIIVDLCENVTCNE
ncbi:calcium-binding EGF-like domain-containing protein, partial [bacterium]|nr:calcium-binding EGF-like domain-containing protein [bacterium]